MQKHGPRLRSKPWNAMSGYQKGHDWEYFSALYSTYNSLWLKNASKLFFECESEIQAHRPTICNVSKSPTNWQNQFSLTKNKECKLGTQILMCQKHYWYLKSKDHLQPSIMNGLLLTLRDEEVSQDASVDTGDYTSSQRALQQYEAYLAIDILLVYCHQVQKVFCCHALHTSSDWLQYLCKGIPFEGHLVVFMNTLSKLHKH